MQCYVFSTVRAQVAFALKNRHRLKDAYGGTVGGVLGFALGRVPDSR